MSLNNLGDVLRALGEHVAAGRAYDEAQALFLSLDTATKFKSQGMLHNFGYVALAAGDIAAAARMFLEAADIYREVGDDRRGLAECVVGLACTAVRSGDRALAARLFGSAEAALEQARTVITPANQAGYERGLAELADAMPEHVLAAERGIGRATSLEQAVESARVLAVGPPVPDPPTQRRRAEALTEREREVALLLARGLRNRDISDTLVITEKTAANHVHRVLDKLGVRSRAEVAARAAELGLRQAPAEGGSGTNSGQ
jgi:non-specific serine/threonine protein kinase